MSNSLTSYTGLITSEHSDKLRFVATIQLSAQPFVDAQALLSAMSTQSFDLDTAIGAQLDAVGVRVGFSRYLEVPITQGFFSWDTPNLGWDQGFWEGQFAVGSQQFALDDSTYREMLRLKIAANVWDGTNETFDSLLPFALIPTGNTLTVLDNQNMSITIVITGPPLPPFLAALLTSGVANYKPAGIELTYAFLVTNGIYGVPRLIPSTIPLQTLNAVFPSFGTNQQQQGGGTGGGGTGGGSTGGGGTGGGGTGGGGTGGGGSTFPGDPVGVQASRIADVMEKFGVNTFSSLDPNSNVWGAFPADYSLATTISAINWLTAGNLSMIDREYHYAGRESIQSTWCPGVNTGTTQPTFFIMCTGSAATDSDIASQVGLAQASAAATQHWMLWTEGANEPNLNGIAVSVTDQMQSDLYAGTNGLVGIQNVVGPSIVFGVPGPAGYITAYAAPSDIASLSSHMTGISSHVYPFSVPTLDSGSNTGGMLAEIFTGLNSAYGTFNNFITEFHTTLFNSNTNLRPGGSQWTPQLDAYWLSIFIMEAFRQGYSSYIWFSLMDYAPGQASQILSGLFPQTFANPRPAAFVIRNMYTLAGLGGPTKRTFTASKLDFTVTGLPGPINAQSPRTGGQFACYQNDAGQFMIPIYNVQLTPGGATTPVVVQFGAARTRIRDFDITAGTANDLIPVQDLSNASSITVNLSAAVHWLIVDY